jgi:hypothetical protein
MIPQKLSFQISKSPENLLRTNTIECEMNANISNTGMLQVFKPFSNI